MNEPTANRLDRRSFLIGGAIAAAGIVGARSTIGALGGPTRMAMAQDATPDATATRQAELDELDALRTQVAATPDCAEPTPSPTPTEVPPVPAGTEIAISQALNITVKSIAPAMAPADRQITGQLLQINFSVRNGGAESEKLVFQKFTLTSAEGDVAVFDTPLNTDLFGSDIALAIKPGTTSDLSMAFDFPNPAATSFLLTNEEYPTFRCAVTAVERG